MWSKLARAAYLLGVALMIVSWAMSATKSKPMPVVAPNQIIGTMDC